MKRAEAPSTGGYRSTDEVTLVATPTGKLRNFLPLVFNLVRQKGVYNGGVIDNADLVNTGVLALLETAKRYDRKKGNNLSTFAYRRISGSIHDLIEKEHNHRKRIESVDNPEFISEATTSPEAPDRTQLFRQVMDVIEGWLPDDQAFVVVRLFIEEQEPAEVAQELGITEQDVLDLRDEALVSLRKYFLTEADN